VILLFSTDLRGQQTALPSELRIDSTSSTAEVRCPFLILIPYLADKVVQFIYFLNKSVMTCLCMGLNDVHVGLLSTHMAERVTAVETLIPFFHFGNFLMKSVSKFATYCT